MSNPPTETPDASAAPVLKWAGGKRRLLAQYRKHFPSKFDSYYEPFFGGGAVYFWLYRRGLLQGKKVVLNDINPELINFYRVLQSDCEALIERLREHAEQHEKEYYYEVRGRREQTELERAARLMYLNRTCFNGLYRVNSKGEFNVPMGRYKNPLICDPDGLRVASRALREVEFRVGYFKDATEGAKEGDLVYFDPPYVPLNTTSNFTSYTRENFTFEDQRALAETFKELAERGVIVRLSNSDTKLVRNLFKDLGSRNIKKIMAPRAINSKADRRQKVAELLVKS